LLVEVTNLYVEVTNLNVGEKIMIDLREMNEYDHIGVPCCRSGKDHIEAKFGGWTYRIALTDFSNYIEEMLKFRRAMRGME
jgi:hypothetical protein